LKATVQFKLKALTGWVVLANNPLENVENIDDYKIHLFERTPRISTYLFCLCAGE